MYHPPTRRFERIARDLEKLPCELHDGVLADLTFAQLLRLSRCAGPNLTSSLSNSLAPWGKYFRDKDAVTEWQEYLQITDDIKHFCEKDQDKWYWSDFRPEPYPSPRYGWAFLDEQIIAWAKRWPRTVIDRAFLSEHWYKTITGVIWNTVGCQLRTNWLTHVEPWMATFENLHGDTSKTLVKMRDLAQTKLSTEELSSFIKMYQELRRIKAEAKAAELNRWADLYEAFPTQLKEPFAPQILRSNEKHVPNNMRREARRVTRQAQNGLWVSRKEWATGARFGWPFPTLVNFEYCSQLIQRALPESAVAETNMNKDVLASYKIVSARPSWALATDANTEIRPVTNIMDSLQGLGVGEAALSNKPILPRQHGYRPYDEAKLRWLEAFVTVIKWMEATYPEDAQVVRSYNKMG